MGSAVLVLCYFGSRDNLKQVGFGGGICIYIYIYGYLDSPSWKVWFLGAIMTHPHPIEMILEPENQSTTPLGRSR